jgi:hypothetical protein
VLDKQTLPKKNYMNISPTYAPFGDIFFSQNPQYEVPKYQRGYAWTKKEINEFIHDLDENLNKRLTEGQKRGYFFGGILTVRHVVDGIANQINQEIIDGQQRITTFTLLGLALINQFNVLIRLKKIDTESKEFIQDKIDELTKSFIEYKTYKNKKPLMMPVLTLSGKDNSFYYSFMRGQEIEASSDSHRNIITAYNSMYKFLSSKLRDYKDFEQKKSLLSEVIDMIKEDLNVLVMTTDNKDDAYTLFEVVNDRGRPLNESDLIRTRVLQFVDEHLEIAPLVQTHWDAILTEDAKNITDNFNWIFESYYYRRPKSSQLASEYIKSFYGVSDSNDPAYYKIDFARRALSQSIVLKNDMTICRKLKNGQWPYVDASDIEWKEARLKAIIKDLAHTKSIPLLIAAVNCLPESTFLDLICIIERFFIRYKTICGGSEGDISKAYLTEVRLMRDLSHTYELTSIKKSLQVIIDSSANDEILSAKIDAIRYSENDAKRNKRVKALLLTLECYLPWFLSTAKKPPTPTILDKSKIFNFDVLEVEHIYPQNSIDKDLEMEKEEVMHSLPNLTLMPKSQNARCGNRLLCEKADIYKESTTFLNRILIEDAQPRGYTWSLDNINSRNRFIKSALNAILVP